MRWPRRTRPSCSRTIIAEAIARSGIPAAAVDQVLAGCVTQVGDQAYNIGRIAWLTAGLPDTVAGTTLDAQCGSSHQAVTLGAALIRAGGADVVVACGVEVMSRHPLGSNVAPGPGHPMGDRYRELYEVTTQGEAAERIAERWGIDRDECDEIGLRSQELAAAAWDAGRYDGEVLPLEQLQRDEGLRSTTREGLAGLKTPFREHGVLTAGSSSQISDGAAALVLVSDALLERHGIEALGTVGEATAVGVDPVLKLDRTHSRDAPHPRADGTSRRGLRAVRDQRGVRERDRGMAARDRRAPRTRQRQRRGDRAGTPRGRERSPALHHRAARAAPPGRGPRPRGDVLRRRAGTATVIEAGT